MAEEQLEDDAAESVWAPVKRRLLFPIRQVTFWLVLLLGIVVIGCLAVWIEEVNVLYFVSTPENPSVELEPLRLAYATAILAIASPCLMQLFLAEKKMLRVAAIGLSVVVLWLAYLAASGAGSISSVHWSGLPGLALAILCWWLANGEDQLFQDRPELSGPSGGDVHRDLNSVNKDVRT